MSHKFPFEKEQLQHKLQRPHHHSRSFRNPDVKEAGQSSSLLCLWFSAASIIKCGVPWLSADLWSSTRKLVRGNESLSSVEGALSRGKRDRDLGRVHTLSEREKSHVYLEQKAGLAVQGECAAQIKII